MGFYLLGEPGIGLGGVGELGLLSWSCSYLLSKLQAPSRFSLDHCCRHPEALHLPTSLSLCSCLFKGF